MLRPLKEEADFLIRGGAPETDFLQLWGEETPEAAILHAVGEIDLWTAPTLDDRLNQLLRRGMDVILDLKDVSYFDLSALKVVEDALEAFQSHERILLVASPSTIVHRIMAILNIQQIETFPTIAEAQKFLHDRRTS